jgi:hypothetical protein
VCRVEIVRNQGIIVLCSKDEDVLDKICFEDIRLNYPSQLFFNFPHSRAINIFFVLTAIVNKTNYEIGNEKVLINRVREVFVRGYREQWFELDISQYKNRHNIENEEIRDILSKCKI